MAEQKLLFSSLWDLADTSYRYGVYGSVLRGEGNLVTSGSSTTVSEQDTGRNIFQGTANGDLIHVKTGPDVAWVSRIVTDATLAPDSVVVNQAVDWDNSDAGYGWSFQKWNNGTTASDGWFSVRDFSTKSVQFQWVTKNAASADVTIQGRCNGGTGTTLYTKNYTAVGSDVFSIPEFVDEIRVGVQITTDAGANNFKVTFSGERFVG